MRTTKITAEEIAERSVSSLPTRPTAPPSQGGGGYTPAELKAAFDRLPLYIVGKFNSLLDDIEAVGEGSLASSIKTGFTEGHSLCDLFFEIESGDILCRIPCGNSSLLSLLLGMEERLCRLEERSANEQTEA